MAMLSNNRFKFYWGLQNKNTGEFFSEIYLTRAEARYLKSKDEKIVRVRLVLDE